MKTKKMKNLNAKSQATGLAGATLILLLAPAALSQAQTPAPSVLQQNPQLDAGVISEGQKRSNRAAKEVVKPKKPTAKPEINNKMPPVHTSLAGLKLSMQGFKIEGDILVSQDGLANALKPWSDRELTFPEFEQAVHAAAKYLRDNGHPNVQVRISRAAMHEGQVAIALEGLTPQAHDYAQAPAPEPKVAVKSFTFTGATVATAEELQEVVKPWAGRELTVKEMQQPAEAVANHLRAKGYTLAQAYLPQQRIDQGVLQIAVQEGVVDKTAGVNGIVVEGAGKRIKPEIIAKTLAQGAPAGQPLKVKDLEQSLLVANELPAVKVKADLEPGREAGTTQVRAKVEEGKLAAGSVWLDNYGSRYTGQTRLNGLFNLNSPTGYGDLLSFNAITSSGMSSGKLAWQLPVGVKGDRIGASFSSMTLDLSQQITPVPLDGKTEVFSLYGTHPLLRSVGRNMWANASLDYKTLPNNLAGVRENDRRVTLGTAGLSGDLMDRFGGFSNWSASVGLGHADLSANASDAARDAAGARTAGGFSKFNFAGTRLAPLGASKLWSWYASLSGQMANKNLDTGEKFQLGGPGGVRAYPVGEAFGDQGLLATLEVRRQLPETRIGEAMAFGFVDVGTIQQYQSPWTLANGAPALTGPNSYSLKGAGLGLQVTHRDVASLKLMAARKLGSNPNPTATGTDSDGRSSTARVWIIGTVKF